MNNLCRAAALCWVLLSSLLSAQQVPNSGDFFIISSVDLAKRQLLLKLPTEVTELMKVEDKTSYHDETGKSIKLSDLRAGDTVFITSVYAAGGYLALTIRKGPMTLQLLRERYLNPKK